MSRKDSEVILRSMEEEKEYHRRYLRAVNSPIRRGILKALKEGAATTAILQSKTGWTRKAWNGTSVFWNMAPVSKKGSRPHRLSTS